MKNLFLLFLIGAFCATASTAKASACDPLMVDLSGDGIFLSSPAAGVYFDLHGFVAKTAWPTSSDDGFLAVDVNGDGYISGSELFGGSWVKSPGGDGFGSLAPYDIAGGSNGGPDGSITADDPIYASLLVWIDVNRDGVSQPGELFTLPTLSITSLSIVSDMDHPTSDAWGNADLGSSPTSGKARIHAMIPAQASTGGGHTNATSCDGGGGGGGSTPPPAPWHCTVSCSGTLTASGSSFAQTIIVNNEDLYNWYGVTNDPGSICGTPDNGSPFYGSSQSGSLATAQNGSVSSCRASADAYQYMYYYLNLSSIGSTSPRTYRVDLPEYGFPYCAISSVAAPYCLQY